MTRLKVWWLDLGNKHFKACYIFHLILFESGASASRDIVIVHHLILQYFDGYCFAYIPCREETEGKLEANISTKICLRQCMVRVLKKIRMLDSFSSVISMTPVQNYSKLIVNMLYFEQLKCSWLICVLRLGGKVKCV
jgi:hypothetical protein